MSEFGYTVAFIAIIFILWLLFEYWQIILPIIGVIIVVGVILYINGKKKEERKKAEEERLAKEAEDAALYLAKAAEAESRAKFATTAYDVSSIVYNQYMHHLENAIRNMENDAKTSPSFKPEITYILHLSVYKDCYYFSDPSLVPSPNYIYFERDLRKSNLKDQFEANAFSYAILLLVLASIDDIQTTLSITSGIHQEELTLENMNKMRLTSIKLTTQNPNYKNVTDWRQSASSASTPVSKENKTNSSPNSSKEPFSVILADNMPVRSAQTPVRKNPVVTENKETTAKPNISARLRKDSSGEVYNLSSSNVTLGTSGCDIYGGYAAKHIKFSFHEGKWYVADISENFKNGDTIRVMLNNISLPTINGKVYHQILKNNDKITLINQNNRKSTYTFIIL